MDGEDVVAQPRARVGDAAAAPGRRARPMRIGERAGLLRARPARRARGSPTARTAAARRSTPRSARGRGCRRARAPRRRGRARRPPRAGSPPRARPRRGARPPAARGRRRGSRAGPAPRSALDQRRAQLGAPEQVLAARGAEVEVRDDEGAHRVHLNGVRPRLGVRRMAPLDGILVADFSRVLAGPLAAMLLGDLGADVVKVERPDGGDDTRHWGPPWRDGRGDLLPRPQPQQALARARPRRRGGRRARARARRPRRRAHRVLPPRPDRPLGTRRRDAARDREPRPRDLLGHRVRHERGGPRPARLRLPRPGDGRADERHRRGGRARR